MDFVQFYDYLIIARAKLLSWIREQPASVYTRTFPFGRGSIRATLVHVASAEWGYTHRLRGESVAPADSPSTEDRYPEFAAFERAWNQQRPATRAALANLGDPARRVEYVARAARVRTTAGGIAGQLLFHEIHHRAQVMAMLKQVEVKAEDLDYSVLMMERTPLG